MNIYNLQSKFRGKTVIVFSCGPSLKSWKRAVEEYPDALIICIKDSIELINIDCDVHIINDVNLKRYNYKGFNIKPFIIYGEGGDLPKLPVKNDFFYQVHSDGNFNKTIAGSKSLSEFNNKMEFSSNRPWGPGIMYEIVFPFLVFCKVSKIITVGWDIADIQGNNSHYNDFELRDDSSCLSNNHPLFFFFKRFVKSCCPSYIFKTLNKFYLCSRYFLGNKVNKAGMIEGEAELVASSIELLNQWLTSKHVELKINSKSKWHSY